jgi:hypothetical protein
MVETSASVAGRVVFLHVGVMKTGTTYLQQLMYANRDALAATGVLLPGKDWSRQVRAVQDLLRLSRLDPHVRTDKPGAWEELAREVRASRLPVAVVSVEFLGGAHQRAIRRAVASLAPAEVRVVLTVRDIAGVLPGLWQTQVHNGARYGWPGFLHDVVHPHPVPRLPMQRHRPQDVFRRSQDVPAMLARWSSVVGADHVHVVTVPGGQDPAELWQRFAAVIGVDPALATRSAPTSNASIGLAATELLRRVNGHIGRLPPSEYNGTVKGPLALRLLAEPATAEGRARLTPEGYDFALRWNARTRAAVAASGVQVSGTLDDLPVVAEARHRAGLPPVPPGPEPRRMLYDAALALRALDRMQRRRRRRLARLGIQVEPVEDRDLDAVRRRWESAADPVDAAARDLAQVARQAALLLRRLRRAEVTGALSDAGAGNGRSRRGRSSRSLRRSRR